MAVPFSFVCSTPVRSMATSVQQKMSRSVCFFCFFVFYFAIRFCLSQGNDSEFATSARAQKKTNKQTNKQKTSEEKEKERRATAKRFRDAIFCGRRPRRPPLSHRLDDQDFSFFLLKKQTKIGQRLFPTGGGGLCTRRGDIVPCQRRRRVERKRKQKKKKPRISLDVPILRASSCVSSSSAFFLFTSLWQFDRLSLSARTGGRISQSVPLGGPWLADEDRGKEKKERASLHGGAFVFLCLRLHSSSASRLIELPNLAYSCVLRSSITSLILAQSASILAMSLSTWVLASSSRSCLARATGGEKEKQEAGSLPEGWAPRWSGGDADLGFLQPQVGEDLADDEGDGGRLVLHHEEVVGGVLQVLEVPLRERRRMRSLVTDPWGLGVGRSDWKGPSPVLDDGFVAGQLTGIVAVWQCCSAIRKFTGWQCDLKGGRLLPSRPACQRIRSPWVSSTQKLQIYIEVKGVKAKKKRTTHTFFTLRSSLSSSYLAFWRANRLIFCWSSRVMWMSVSWKRKRNRNRKRKRKKTPITITVSEISIQRTTKHGVEKKLIKRK